MPLRRTATAQTAKTLLSASKLFFTVANLRAPPTILATEHVSYEERVPWFQFQDSLQKFEGKSQNLIVPAISTGTLHHVELYVSDLTKSFEFWSWLLTELNYRSFQKWNSGFSFLKESTYLVFVQTEERFLDVAYHRKRSGLNHLAFHIESKTELEALQKKLELKKVSFLYQDKSKDTLNNTLFFEDCDRKKIELVGPIDTGSRSDKPTITFFEPAVN